MIVHPVSLAASLLLLWTPRQLLRVGSAVIKENRGKPEEESDPRHIRAPGDISLRIGEELAKTRNYLDLLRGVAGTLFLLGTPAMDPALMAASSGGASAAKVALAARVAVLGMGVVLQMIRWDGRPIFFPPVFFMIGMAGVMAGPEPTLAAIIIAWLASRAFSTPTALFICFGLLLGVFGFVFDGKSLTLIASCALLMVPPMISLLTGRPLYGISRRIVREAE